MWHITRDRRRAGGMMGAASGAVAEIFQGAVIRAAAVIFQGAVIRAAAV